MRLFKNGFTLSELLVALGVIGVLVSVLLPVIQKILPDQNGLMAKRAYYTIQSTVSDMINDADCYPDLTEKVSRRNTLGERFIGFDDGYGYINCEHWGASSDTERFITHKDAKFKFIYLFASKLDLKEDFKSMFHFSDEDFLALPDSDIITLDTKDGMTWRFPVGDCKLSQGDKTCTIYIDVNGTDGPNCTQTSGLNAAVYGNDGKCQNRTTDFDRFSVTVNADGALTINDEWAQKAVDISKDIANEENDDDDENSD